MTNFLPVTSILSSFTNLLLYCSGSALINKLFLFQAPVSYPYISTYYGGIYGAYSGQPLVIYVTDIVRYQIYYSS
jgi:hypothetical protein